MSNNKKDKAFFQVKDSYKEKFPALLQCTSVLQSELIPLYQTSLVPPGYLPI
jgi:hypothetical protein